MFGVLAYFRFCCCVCYVLRAGYCVCCEHNKIELWAVLLCCYGIGCGLYCVVLLRYCGCFVRVVDVCCCNVVVCMCLCLVLMTVLLCGLL